VADQPPVRCCFRIAHPGQYGEADLRELGAFLIWDLLRQTASKTTVHADRRFVDNGRVVCSAGIAAGIDMSLHVGNRLLGHEVAERTARQMEYPWEVDGRYAGRHGHG
jgi:hypothetical protein